MKKYIVLFICIIFYSFAFAQQISKEEKLNEMIDQGMKDWQIPGLAAVVVKDGKVVFKKSYGVKDLETKEPVNENTTFSMGSTTKAIIAISLGILVDQGKIKWDDKVIDYLPSFRLSDSYITADARVKDLLTHNLGIEDTQLIFELESEEKIIDKFRFAKKTYPLRGGFIYQNVMYVIAGELIEAVSGLNWKDFIQKNIFIPLEMNRTSSRPLSILNAGNYATPHFNDLEDGIFKVEIEIHRHEVGGSAGGIWSSVNDISNYLIFLLNHGVYKKDTILQLKTFNYLFEPHSILTEEEYYPTNVLTKPNWNTYGFGWFQQDYRGLKLDFHTGSILGLVAIAGVIHKENLAVFVFANLDHAELRHAIMYKAIDLYVFNDDSRNWHKETFELYSKFRDQRIEALKKRNEDRVLGTSTSLKLDQYCGTYKNEMYGDFNVKVVDGKLQLSVFNNQNFQMEHWHYNTFITNKTPSVLERIFVNFNLNEFGKTKELEIFGETFTKTN